jgi:demethylmenaquinone methyltransferase/2-methoxy-6-polyprenyl-1,4-benzoquinol methylase
MSLMTEELGRYSGFWDRLAPIWDYGLSICGMKEKYRKRAVDKLNLNCGDTVLDLACGSGLNFKYLQEKVGEEGKIIGLDYSSKMLEVARRKIEGNNWNNVKLIREDAANFDLDEDVDGVLCTWAMVSIPDYIGALKNSIDVLKEGGKYVVLDFKENPGYAGKILNPIYRAIFSATHQDITRTPWKEMKKYLEDVEIEEFPFGSILGTVYIAHGTKPRKS